MKVLIVGLGYAGTRFRRSFESLWLERNDGEGRLAYVGRKKTHTDISFYDNVETALIEYQPDIVVLSVNDVYRAEVSKSLAGFQGFVICEKPLVCPWDDLQEVERYFSNVSGFCLNLVERYSPISATLKDYVEKKQLQLLRANFTWGKDRIGDHRPTCGVTSEIIHALDLIQHISGIQAEYRFGAVHGVRSDFSISGPDVIDSVSLLGSLDEAVVSGYASFVNASRRREIGFIFARPQGGLVFANMTFDDPTWDNDTLRVWEIVGGKETALVDEQLVPTQSASGDMGIVKLGRLVSDVTMFIEGSSPHQEFPDLLVAIRLQTTLNSLHERVAGDGRKMAFSRYGPISFSQGSEQWERLG